MQYCDLHTHSNHSDGTCTPREVLALAKQAGLSAVMLCDHNTVSGLPEFMAAAEDIEAIGGTEFSTDYRGVELHILAMFIKPAHYAAVTEKAAPYLIGKERSSIELCQGLTAAGMPLDYEKIKAKTVDGFVNRAVIANEMVRLGYVQKGKDAFDTWLSEKKGLYKPPVRPDALEIIRFIKSIGAVAVLAHPFLKLTEAELEELLPLAVEAGLDGMEVLYPKYSPEETAASYKLVEKYNLLPSGGSDFHGKTKPDTFIGVGRGDLKIPYAWVQQLKMKKN